MSLHGKIAVYSLAAALAFLPLSVMICHGAIIVFLIHWVFEGGWSLKWKVVTQQPYLWCFIGLLFMYLLGVTYSDDVGNAWFAIEKKAFFFLVPVALATSRSLDKSSVRTLFVAFVSGCLVATGVCIVMAIVNYMGAAAQVNFDPSSEALYRTYNPNVSPAWMFFSYIGLASGIGMHPTFFALYLSFCLVLLIHFHYERFASYSIGLKIGIATLFVHFQVFLILLSSRMLILASMVVVLGYLYVLMRTGIARPLQEWVLGLLVVGDLLLVIMNPVTRYRNVQEPFAFETYSSRNGMYTYSTGIRKSLFVLGGQAVLRVNPFFGAGTGDVTSTIKKLGEERSSRNIMNTYDPHNQYLFAYLGQGILGLLALLGCMFLPLKSALANKHFVYVAFVALVSMSCLTESILESQKGIIFFALSNSLLVFLASPVTAIQTKELTYG